MNRTHSLSKLSSKSLSKAKEKVEKALGRKDPKVESRPLRSQSSHSLAATVKAGKTNREHSVSSLKKNTVKERVVTEPQTGNSNDDRFVVKQYAWFDQQGRNMHSATRRTASKDLRYFACSVSPGSDSQLIAAIEDSKIFMGGDYHCEISPGQAKPANKNIGIELRGSKLILVFPRWVGRERTMQLRAQCESMVSKNFKAGEVVKEGGRRMGKWGREGKEKETFLLLIIC